MAAIKIPFCEREITEDAKIIEHPGVITAELNMTAEAEETWEKKFTAQAAAETVFAYVQRLSDLIERTPDDPALFFSALKAFYCFLESEELPEFKNFLHLFDFSNKEMLDRQIKVIRTAFELVLGGSVVTAKN